MDSIADYEARITAALDRIEQAMAPAAIPQTDSGEVSEVASEEVAALKAALQSERDINQRLEARVEAVREKLLPRVNKWKTKALRLETELEALRAEREQDVQEIGQVLTELRTTIGGQS